MKKSFLYLTHQNKQTMKTKAAQLSVGQTIKFSNLFGTHTMVINSKELSCKGEILVKGLIVKTTNKTTMCFVQGEVTFNYFRKNTQITIL